jgi:hypothetical protein
MLAHSSFCSSAFWEVLLVACLPCLTDHQQLNGCAGEYPKAKFAEIRRQLCWPFSIAWPSCRGIVADAVNIWLSWLAAGGTNSAALPAALEAAAGRNAVTMNSTDMQHVSAKQTRLRQSDNMAHCD